MIKHCLSQGPGPEEQLCFGGTRPVSYTLHHLLAPPPPQSHTLPDTITIWEISFKTQNQCLGADFKQYGLLVCEDNITQVEKAAQFRQPRQKMHLPVWKDRRTLLERALGAPVHVWQGPVGSHPSMAGGQAGPDPSPSGP
uniref:Uncharacterized protein n=1 Tax=Molossus molossus TaxID=27622 RepID=A0A7J8HZY3_MOLMO|nr:hypothetical protein HJG59_010826 [Molossus molossus]